MSLNCRRRAKFLLDTHAQDKMEDEDPTLFLVLKQRRCREIRQIKVVQDADRTTYTTPKDIRNTFVQHLACIFDPITVDENVITDCSIAYHL